MGLQLGHQAVTTKQCSLASYPHAAEHADAAHTLNVHMSAYDG